MISTDYTQFIYVVDFVIVKIKTSSERRHEFFDDNDQVVDFERVVAKIKMNQRFELALHMAANLQKKNYENKHKSSSMSTINKK